MWFDPNDKGDEENAPQGSYFEDELDALEIIFSTQEMNAVVINDSDVMEDDEVEDDTLS